MEELLASVGFFKEFVSHFDDPAKWNIFVVKEI